MTTFADNLDKFTELQKKSLEPVRNYAELAVEAFETVARTNYAFFGDALDYAISQARLPLEVSDPKELFERQSASGREFAEVINARVNEYVDLGKSFNEKSTSLFENDVVKPAKEAAEAAANQAA